MAAPAITLDVLPAAYGDCLLVSCPVAGGEWRLLVDTGPDETYPALQTRLRALPLNGAGKRHINLAIISHVDHDHIGGARLLFDDRSLNLGFSDIWFNARAHRVERGIAEGESLASVLGAAGSALPWNVAFGGKAVATPGDGGFVELPAIEDHPRITLLSPSPACLVALFKVWDKTLAALRAKQSARPVELLHSRGAEALDIRALAAKRSATDRAVPNASSIAILVEHRGAAMLLGADAVPTVMTPALAALAKQRGLADGLHVDVFKLSHHGSRGNLTADLLKAIHADHYVFSTNGAIFHHPDDEAVARAIVHGSKRPTTLWFNYATPRNRRWADPQLRETFGYAVVYPQAGGSGVTIAVPGRDP